MRYYRTNTTNKVSYKDRYCANFNIESAEESVNVLVNLLDGTVKIDRELYSSDRNLAKSVYEFAGYNGGFRKMSDSFTRFLLVIGYMTADNTDYLSRVAQDVEDWNKEFGSIFKARMTKSGNVKLSLSM